MIDHLIRCATQADADALAAQYGPSRAYQPKVILQDAVWDTTDPDNPVMTTPAVLAEGYHVWLALDALEPALRDLPDDNCRLIADRNAALAGVRVETFMLFHAADITDQLMQVARIEPVPAGSGYPFRKI